MSQADRPSAAPRGAAKNVPEGLAKGILGFVLGAGVSFLGMHFYGPREYIRVPFSGEGPAPGAPVMQMGGATPSPPAGGGGMGGGGAADKRNLTSLVGRLELLSRKDLNLHVELNQDQSAKLAAELAELESAKTLTAEEAQSRLEAIEALLTPEQKEVVDSIGLPFNRPSGGGGPGGGMGAPAPDENPFTQERNEKRLKDLLERLKSAGPENAKS